MNPKWQYCNVNSEEAEKLKETYKINDLLALILANRNIDIEKAKVFLEPTRNDFYDPFEMPDMEKAVERIIDAINTNEKITIYGDYDVDGITSITTLKRFLEERGLEVDYYIPHRLDEGYGLNKEAIKKIADMNTDLMITVDCGITGVEEVEYAKSLNIDVIITDHHEPSDILPKAIAVVDCKRKDNMYPFRELAGVGVVFKLIQAISIKLQLEQKEYLKYLDMVSIGTISDIVPLKDENRVITKLGLKLVECTKNCGLKAILNNIGYNKIDSSSISYGVAPRINACGRMGYADVAVNLLMSKDIDKAEEFVLKLNSFNNERQEKEKNILNDVLMQIENKKMENENSIILSGKEWHSGVIGIVASKITDLYFKPCILFCFNEDSDIGKGSGRSIPGFDLHGALVKCQNDLETFGGHSMAVGVAIKEENIDKFRKDFSNVVKEALGVFQLIMTTYLFGITLASAGLNITSIKLISEEFALNNLDNAKRISIKCTKIGLIAGILTGIFFIINSKFIVTYCLHDKVDNYIIYLIALALPLISMSSSLSGYFIATRNIKKNVIGNFIEQLSKIIITYLILNYYPNTENIKNICLTLIIGDVLSEIISFIYLVINYRKEMCKFKQYKTKNNKNEKIPSIKSNLNLKIFKILIPIALTSYLRSGISTIKQLIIPFSLERSGINCQKALSDYGIISGMTMPIIMFPAIFLGILANLLIPEFSRYYATNDYYKIKKYTNKLLSITLLFSCFISLNLWIFGKQIGLIIYNNLSVGNYIKIFSIIIPFMYIDIIIDSILKGINEQVYVMKVNIIDLIISTLIILFIVPTFGIKGYIFSIFISEIVNLILSLKRLVKCL